MATDSIFYNYFFTDEKTIANFFDALEIMLKEKKENKNNSAKEINCRLMTDEEGENFIKRHSKNHL